MKRGLSWIGLALAMVLMVSCANKNGESEGPKAEEPKQVVSPLTGKLMENIDHPAIMVMVNNHRKARPQSGLHKADVVVEILAEGEITRFAAFYHSDLVGTVGPVRSVRPYYLDLAAGAHAVVAHAGGSKDALDRIQKEKIPSMNGIGQESDLYTRVSFRKAPHNLYAKLEDLLKASDAKGYGEWSVQGGYRFSENPATHSGKPAETIDLQYHSLYQAGYRYDSASGRYIRYTEGERQEDRESGQPLSMENVIAVFARHQSIDWVGHRKVDVTGSGKGYLFQRGKVIPIDWKYENGWVVPYREGKVIHLIPGKTWVNILPETGKIQFR